MLRHAPRAAALRFRFRRFNRSAPLAFANLRGSNPPAWACRQYPGAQEDSIEAGALIPGARVSSLEGNSILGDAGEALKIIGEFLASLPSERQETPEIIARGPLSQREIEVLRLLATGKSNAQIADELVISLNTVRRHVSNIFDKTGVTNRSEATSYAIRHGIA